MPFRERVKRALGRSTSNSETSSLHKQDSRKNSNSNSANNNNNIYQPGEAMPKAKYRQPVDKKHKEHLESFNFMSNFTDALSRRKSQASQYSPMGSRLSSRNNSLTHPGAGAAAMGMAPPKLGRGQSYIEQVVENADDDTDPVNGEFSNSLPFSFAFLSCLVLFLGKRGNFLLSRGILADQTFTCSRRRLTAAELHRQSALTRPVAPAQ